MANKEAKRTDGIDVVAIMTPPGSHQAIAETFINKNINIISDKPFAGNLKQAKSLLKKIKSNFKNVEFILDIRDSIDRVILFNNEYEEEQLEYLFESINNFEPSLLIDIGANIRFSSWDRIIYWNYSSRHLY